ncbi:phospholipase A and acyltransferase 2-like [Patiria miniata]|uniref:LRAT domain-containing protein n=1 Tax=Patiria miniata TaxID=46514 RepID=A0A914AQS0_PATMI|nr:phospholipase A and acyltransferase 2-like [Patiria miniata]
MASYNNYEIVSDWFTSENINDLECKLCVGDRLEFTSHHTDAHWGIYVGQYQGIRHTVIHCGLLEREVVLANQKPEIRADTIGRILVSSGKVRINNSSDTDQTANDSQLIMEIAKKMHLDKTPSDYNLLSENCEHFANYCRYGAPSIEQAASAVGTFWSFLRSVIGKLDLKMSH